MLVKVKLVLMGFILLASVALASLRAMPWHWIVCAALGFSWIGDAMLAKFPPIASVVREPFLFGMGAFAVAQVLYCIAFGLSMRAMPALYFPHPGKPLGSELVGKLLPIFMLAGLLCWVWFIYRSQQSTVMKLSVLLYCQLLCAMVAFSCSAAFTGVRFVWLLPVGGLLFAISDGIIALQIFQNRFVNEKLYEAAVWATYVPAQLFLLIGASWLC